MAMTKTGRPIHIYLLVVIFIVAFLSRFLYCFQYLNTDEYVTFWDAMKFIREKTFISHHTVYPPFYSYLATITIGCWALILRVLGIVPSVSSISSFYYMHSITAIFPARVLSLMYGMGSIICVYMTGARFFSKHIGLCAAAFIALSTVHAESSALGLPDMQMSFFATLSLYFALQAYESPSICAYALSGLCVGLAATSKYNGVFSAFSIIVVHVLHLHHNRCLWNPLKWVWSKVGIATLLCIGGFFVCSMGLLISPALYIESIASASAKMSSGMLGAYQGIPYLAFVNLFFHHERIWAILFFCGLASVLYQYRQKNLILICSIILSFVLLGRWKIQYLKYFLFISSAVALIAGQLLVSVLRRISRPTLRAALCCLIFAIPVYQIATGACYQVMRDNRTRAAAWVNRNVSEGAHIMLDMVGWSIYHLPRLYTAPQKEQYLSDNPLFFADRLSEIRTYTMGFFRISMAF